MFDGWLRGPGEQLTQPGLSVSGGPAIACGRAETIPSPAVSSDSGGHERSLSLRSRDSTFPDGTHLLHHVIMVAVRASYPSRANSAHSLVLAALIAVPPG